MRLSGTSVTLNRTSVNAGSIGGRSGNITIIGDRIALVDSTNLQTPTIFGAEAGRIAIQATGDVTLNGSNLLAQSFGAGRSGGIRISANNIDILGASAVTSNSFGSGAGGDIVIAGLGAVTVDGLNSGALISAGGGGSGDAGNIAISAGTEFLLVNGFVDATTFGAGAGGSISIDAGRSVTLRAPSETTIASLLTQTTGSGNAGSIVVRTGDFTMLGKTSVQAATTGSGAGGNIRVAATGHVRIDNAGLSGLAFITSGTFNGGGTAAGVNIEAGSFVI
jgi:hypothetical protein